MKREKLESTEFTIYIYLYKYLHSTDPRKLVPVDYPYSTENLRRGAP